MLGEKAPKRGSKTVLAVLYSVHGESAASNPAFLGCKENALGLREWLEKRGHTYIVTDDKDGEDCEFEKHLPDANVVITTPFHPAYMTRERMEKAKKLEIILTAGIGSDHIDLHAAAEHDIIVAEVTGSNVVSVAEDELMRILILVRNFLPGWVQIKEGKWNVAAVAEKSHDLEGKTVGTLGAGRIGIELLKRLKPFDLNLLYYARHEKEEASEYAKWEPDLDKFLSQCDVVSINIPLTDKTKGMMNKEKIYKMKKGSFIVNNARGAIMNVEDCVEACESGQLRGYGGDVWYPQPPPPDHPWRHMPNHALTPHLSGTTLDAQARYSAGTKENLEHYFAGEKLTEDNVIVQDGQLAAQYQ